jgi:DNA topoisomerase VI subunit A
MEVIFIYILSVILFNWFEILQHVSYVNVLLRRLELKMMLQKGVKFEIEALSVHTLSFLTESYIPSKIHGKVKI